MSNTPTGSLKKEQGDDCSSDNDAEASSHGLTRKVVLTRVQALEPDGNGGLEVNRSCPEPLVGMEQKATIECRCGERFRKEHTALEHLRAVASETAANTLSEDT